MITLREFYSYYTQLQIEEKKEIVIINPFYETTDLVRETLATGYKAIDVEKYEKKEKRLVIGDSLKKYLGQKEKAGGIADVNLEVEQLNESKENESNKKTTNMVNGKSNWWADNEQMVKHAEKMGNMGLSILADAGAFYFMGKTIELLDYECSLPKQFDLNMKAFCIYNQKDFDRLTEEQKQELVKHHGMVIKIEAH